MDWSRTKTVIIIGLIITNLSILYLLFSSPSKNFMREEKRLKIDIVFEKENININQKENIKEMNLKKYNASFINLDASKYVLSNGSENSEVLQMGEDLEWKTVSGYKLTASKRNKTEAQVNYLMDMNSYVNDFEVINDDVILKKMDEFIKEKIKLDLDKELVVAKKYKDIYYIEYAQVFEGYFLEGSYIKILTQKDHILSYNQKWCEVEAVNNSTITTESYNNIMYRLLREIYNLKELEKYSGNVNIVESKLGYGFGSDGYDIQLKFGEIVPFYRFKTDVGDVFYIDAMPSKLH